MAERCGCPGCSILANVLKLNGLASLAAWIMMMVFRLRHAGKVCSGVYRDDFPLFAFEYLISRGRLFIGLIILSWVIIGLAILGAILACICGAGRGA